ncbi:hypothetical protein ACFOGJ_09035 [Marinibaculum pumilum]|uniref:Uncharacterized protein n=1 Tax=Marinibaculum pumilum TaxID=1766165 RepID=A0ABV7KZG1_9PROT
MTGDCKTLGQVAARVVNDTADRMHATQANELLCDAAFAVSRHDAASLALIADRLAKRAAAWTEAQAGGPAVERRAAE